MTNSHRFLQPLHRSEPSKIAGLLKQLWKVIPGLAVLLNAKLYLLQKSQMRFLDWF